MVVVKVVLYFDFGEENLKSLGVLALPVKAVAPESPWICFPFPAIEMVFLYSEQLERPGRRGRLLFCGLYYFCWIRGAAARFGRLPCCVLVTLAP